MGTKRPLEGADIAPAQTKRRDAKRTKVDPSQEHASNSSEASSCSVSEDSALQSSQPESEHARESSVSSSSSDDSSAPESESDIVTVGGPKKPDMRKLNISDDSQDLKARLASFLPQMQQANSLLADGEGKRHNIEDVEDGERHIEMNLGLGVLEEQDGGSESDDSLEDEENDAPASSATAKQFPEDENADVMRKLMRRSPQREKPGIEDMG